MSRRPSTDHMRRALKLATKAALLASGGAAALVENGLVRVREAALSFCSSPNEEHANRFVGLDVALDLDFCAGEPIHARALASAQGYGLHRLTPEKSAGTFGHSDIRHFAREFAETQDVMFAALDDNIVCRDDQIAMLNALDDVDRMSATIRAKLTSPA